MIAIINKGPHTNDLGGERNYEVRINDEPTRAKLINLGWANGWPEGKLPPIANACQLALMDGEPHNYYEQPQPHLGSCVHRVVCETCGYEYLYDSGD